MAIKKKAPVKKGPKRLTDKQVIRNLQKQCEVLAGDYTRLEGKYAEKDSMIAELESKVSGLNEYERVREHNLRVDLSYALGLRHRSPRSHMTAFGGGVEEEGPAAWAEIWVELGKLVAGKAFSNMDNRLMTLENLSVDERLRDLEDK